MNLTAEIKTGKRRVIEYLLSPIQRATSEVCGRDEMRRKQDSSALSFLGSSPYGNAYLIEATSEPSQDKDKHSVEPTRLAAHAGEAAPEHSSSTPVRCEDVFDLSLYGCDGLEMDAGVVRPQRQLLKLWD
jgi:hypothetical protein